MVPSALSARQVHRRTPLGTTAANPIGTVGHTVCLTKGGGAPPRGGWWGPPPPRGVTPLDGRSRLPTPRRAPLLCDSLSVLTSDSQDQQPHVRVHIRLLDSEYSSVSSRWDQPGAPPTKTTHGLQEGSQESRHRQHEPPAYTISTVFDPASTWGSSMETYGTRIATTGSAPCPAPSPPITPNPPPRMDPPLKVATEVGPLRNTHRAPEPPSHNTSTTSPSPQ
uniref:Uncharacterized protein n=1 Tax=Knipowitschia caucasica TaxID=637954 RepID=A0AAV2MJI6_KNICA